MEEQNIIYGALELHKKTVAEVMTKLEDVYMLNIDNTLDFNTINEIMQQGFIINFSLNVTWIYKTLLWVWNAPSFAKRPYISEVVDSGSPAN